MAAITIIHDCDILRRPVPTALNGDFRDTYISAESTYHSDSVNVTGTTLGDSTASWVIDEWIGSTVYSGGSYLVITSNTATVLTGSAGWVGGTPGTGAYYIDWEWDTNYNGIIMLAGVAGPGGKTAIYEEHALFYFDLNAFIPADATITAARFWFGVFTIPHVPPPAASHELVRLRRTDWLEDEATWNEYKSGSSWTTPGAEDSTDDIDEGFTVVLGLLDTVGWYDFDVETLVDDAWDTRSGICTFMMRRNDGVMGETGNIQLRAKEDPTQSEFIHHLRITYELDSTTFQTFILGRIPEAVAGNVQRRRGCVV